MTRKEMRQAYEAIDNEYQDKQSALFEEMGVYFVFGRDQYEEAIKTEQKKGYEGKFEVGPYSMIIREGNGVDFINRHHELMEEKAEAMRKAITKRWYIEYQLSNHECYYTGYFDVYTISAIHDIFPDATRDEIQKVFSQTYPRHE